MITIKLIFSSLAIIITFIAFVPYIRSTLAGEAKPHVFSWVIWGTAAFVVFFAQLEDKGGMGAWSIGLSGVITVFIAILAFFKKSDVGITRSDWLVFLMALASLPFWYFTSDPLWAVIILTIVNTLGFVPTIRKAYFFPNDENIMFFFLFVVRNTLAIMALENYSVTTMLFPIAVNIACLVVIVEVSYRRKAMQVSK